MRERRRVDERMDDPALEPAEHRRALAGLARLNAVSRSHRLLWPGIREAARAAQAWGRALRVVDVAAGSGDAAAAMARHARAEGLSIDWVLCDLSARALVEASARAERSGMRIATCEADAVRAPLPVRGDVVICSLFLHHCERADAVRVLRHMRAAAEHLVGVTDLDRTRLGLALAVVGSRLLSRSKVVHFDAAASVRAAFTPAEAAGIAKEAGLNGASIERVFPERWRLWWRQGDARGPT